VARLDGLAESLRENRVAIGAAVALVALALAGARWVVRSRQEPVQKRVLTITGVILKPDPPPGPPPPSPAPRVEPRVEEPQSRLVEVKSSDIPPPDAPRPSGDPPPGPLALATAATGEGDAFNLVGNPGGKGLLGTAGSGDGTGIGNGGDGSSRFGWYFGRIAFAIEDSFRRMDRTRTAQTRVELRVWADAAGRITRVELLRSTGNAELDEAIRSIVGLTLREPLPQDIPMPVVYRFTARRPG
jgi:TonB family protein